MLEGPAAIINPTGALLRTHGIDSTSSRCDGERVVRASFTLGGGSSGYALRIRDEYGRTSDRVVRDPETAATLIETWAANEDADLVSPLVHATSERGTGTVVRRIEEIRKPSWRLSTAFDMSFGSDGSQWLGGAVTACATLHGMCVGGRARMAHDDGDSGTAAELDQVQTSGELLAVVSRPLLFRGFSVYPLVGVGAAWTRMSPQTQTDTDPASRYALRLEAAVGGGLALSPSWSMTVEIGASADAASSKAVSSGFSVSAPAVIYRTAIGLTCAR